MCLVGIRTSNSCPRQRRPPSNLSRQKHHATGDVSQYERRHAAHTSAGDLLSRPSAQRTFVEFSVASCRPGRAEAGLPVRHSSVLRNLVLLPCLSLLRSGDQYVADVFQSPVAPRSDARQASCAESYTYIGARALSATPFGASFLLKTPIIMHHVLHQVIVYQSSLYAFARKKILGPKPPTQSRFCNQRYHPRRTRLTVVMPLR
ncbi:hypothetical protein C2E23DRAFT_436099 [Lenzites betulinus]|nr:hypothetical protein C2E23DRAFT_436099 [Lenzites betulinus]